MKPRISICIPTFNRASLLAQSLQRLADSIAEHGVAESVEVCVSDNASEDDTALVITNLKSLFKNFHSTRLPFNTGFCGNLKSVVQLASCDRLVVFGDDDFVHDDTIRLLLKYCEEPQQLTVFNTGKGERFALGRLALVDEIMLKSAECILSDLGVYQLSSIANFMVSRLSLLERLYMLDARSAYPHTIALLDIARVSGAKFVNRSLLISDGDNRDWTILQPVLTSIDLARVLMEGPFSGPLSRSLKLSCSWTLLRSLPRAILLARNGNIKNQYDNPYRAVTHANVRQIYSSTFVTQLLAVSIFAIFSLSPMSLAKRLLFRISSSDKFPRPGHRKATSLDV